MILSLIAAVAVFVPAAYSLHIPQKPLVDGDTQCSDVLGIGFDLSTSYGTAVITFYNETVADVGRVEGDTAYTHLISQLSERGTPFEAVFENYAQTQELQWKTEQELRNQRMLAGLPSTEEIGILSTMISKLKAMTESRLCATVIYAAVTIPHLPKLSKKDFEEATNYAGIRQTMVTSHLYGDKILYGSNTAAARAGMGYGDHFECRDDVPYTKRSLAITYTEDILTVSNIRVLCEDIYIIKSWSSHESLAFQYHDRDVDYWAQIGAEIVATAIQYQDDKIEEIIVLGDRAGEKKFLDAAWKALGDLEGLGLVEGRAADIYARLQVPGFDALYVAARGAAKFCTWVGGPVCKASPGGDNFGKDIGKFAVEAGDGASLQGEQDLKSTKEAVSLEAVAWGSKNWRDGTQETTIKTETLAKVGSAAQYLEDLIGYAQGLVSSPDNTEWRIEIVDVPGRYREIWLIVDQKRGLVHVLTGSNKHYELKENVSVMTVVAWRSANIHCMFERHHRSYCTGEVIGPDSTGILDLGISYEYVLALMDQVRDIADGKDWWIEVVDMQGREREIWAVVDGSWAGYL